MNGFLFSVSIQQIFDLFIEEKLIAILILIFLATFLYVHENNVLKIKIAIWNMVGYRYL